jgi:hypothetical protein
MGCSADAHDDVFHDAQPLQPHPARPKARPPTHRPLTLRAHAGRTPGFAHRLTGHSVARRWAAQLGPSSVRWFVCLFARWAHPGRACTGTGLTPAMHRHWAQPDKQAPGLGLLLPHLRRDWAHPSHICRDLGVPLVTSAPGLGAPRPHLRRDWAHPAHICAGTLQQGTAGALQVLRSPDRGTRPWGISPPPPPSPRQ